MSRTSVVVAWLAAWILAAGPGGLPGQEVELESGFALLAYEASTERLAGAVVNSRPVGASRGLLLDPAVGAVYAAGRGMQATAAAAAARRAGDSPEEAARAGAAGPGPRRVVVLAPECRMGEGRSPGFVGSVEARRGRIAGICYVAVAVQPADPEGLERMISAFEESRGSLAERLTEALGAALGDEPALNPARSAALWVTPPEEEAPGTASELLDRTGLRLQADDHPGAVSRLRQQLRLVTAGELADEASEEIAAGRYGAALARADSALELDPGSAGAWMQRGRALLHDGRAEAAEEAFRRMLELDPTMLRFLGDPTGPSVNERMIPYEPRLLLRLDVYRRAYFRTLDFGPGPTSPRGR